MTNGLMEFLGLAAPDHYFDYWLAQPGEWVEEPNSRRGGFSGMQRIVATSGETLYRKYQVNHCYRDVHHPGGAPTVLREQRALLAFSALGICVPTIVYCGARRKSTSGQWEAVLVTEELPGFDSIENYYDRGDCRRWTESLRTQAFQKIGDMLARLHQGCWQHGSLYPKHIFLRVNELEEQVDVALLDLEKSRPRFTVKQAASHDMRQFRRRVPWTDAEWRAMEAGYQQQMGWTVECKAQPPANRPAA